MCRSRDGHPHRLYHKRKYNMTANLFKTVWALYDAETETTILLDGQLTAWCSFNGVDADQLIIESHQGRLYKDRWQVYNTTIPGRNR